MQARACVQAGTTTDIAAHTPTCFVSERSNAPKIPMELEGPTLKRMSFCSKLRATCIAYTEECVYFPKSYETMKNQLERNCTSNSIEALRTEGTKILARILALQLLKFIIMRL